MVKLLALIALVALAAVPARAANLSAGTELFDRGRARGGASLGWGRAFDQDYMVINGALGYNVYKRTELTLDAEAWTANDPVFYRLSPGIRVTLPGKDRFYPYIGGFYRRTFYSNIPDSDAFGGRAGVNILSGRNTFTSAGVVVQQELDCNDRVGDCTTVYPEIGVSFVF